jgi:hypothetical protein
MSITYLMMSRRFCFQNLYMCKTILKFGRVKVNPRRLLDDYYGVVVQRSRQSNNGNGSAVYIAA